MFDLFIFISLLFFTIIALAFESATIIHGLRRLNQHKRTILSDIYIRQIVQILTSEEYRPLYPSADSPQKKESLAEALHIVLSHTYGTDVAIIKQLVEEYNLDSFIADQTLRRHGMQKAHMLILMSTTPSNRPITVNLKALIASRNRDIGISALLALLATDPSSAIPTISALPYRLRPLDIARLMMLLRRGILPIAYEPLLSSHNSNLRMLGLAIVCNFGIEIAEKHLYNIITSTTDTIVIRETIYTLSSIGRPLSRNSVRHCITTLPPLQRKELCRHLTHEGYSLSALRHIFSPSETAYSESLMKSYKRNLECSSIFNV